MGGGGGGNQTVSYFLTIININSNSLAHRELIHISTTNGSNHFNINSCITVNMILFITDMFSPVGHVVKKAI